ncbi:MAG: hypothetical protein LBC74_00295 [Planctomycetaceae bacterium]|jgi:hypothetical protein|nr:hypothetical protein [Planctomycetaceae bacterium]
MSNWITITWENEQLRLLAARIQSGAVIFEHAVQFTLSKNDDGLSIKDQLSRFLQKNRIGKVDTIVLLNRSDVEVRPMVFPPVPVDELCDLVRFQATREFNAYDQNSPLDFFVTNKFDNISRSALFPSVFSGASANNNKNHTSANGNTNSTSSGGSPIHLLASTIRRDLFQKISNFCEELGLNLRRILLRPCESAYLWKFSVEFNPMRTFLLLELDENETSQTVLYQGEPIFIRSPKISSPVDVSNPDFVVVLAAELRRTMIAVRNEIQGITVDDVIVCGKDAHFAKMSQLLSETLGVPVKMFDAWTDPKLSGSKLRVAGGELIKTSGKLRNDLATGNISNPERYSALIGSILRAGRNTQCDIDFCNPKRRQERIGYRVFVNLAVVVVFLLLVGWVGYEFYMKNLLTENNKAIAKQQTKLDKTAKSIAPLRMQLQAIESWHADKIDWFEQLGWLNRNAPDPRDMMLKTLTLTATQGGSMNFTSLVRNSSIVSPMEEKFRSDNHDVKTGEKSEIRDNSQYRYQVTLWVYLTQSDWNLAPIEDEPILEPVIKDLPGTEKNANDKPNLTNRPNSSSVVNLPEITRTTQPQPVLPPTPMTLPTTPPTNFPPNPPTPEFTPEPIPTQPYQHDDDQLPPPQPNAEINENYNENTDEYDEYEDM